MVFAAAATFAQLDATRMTTAKAVSVGGSFEFRQMLMEQRGLLLSIPGHIQERNERIARAIAPLDSAPVSNDAILAAAQSVREIAAALPAFPDYLDLTVRTYGGVPYLVSRRSVGPFPELVPLNPSPADPEADIDAELAPLKAAAAAWQSQVDAEVERLRVEAEAAAARTTSAPRAGEDAMSRIARLMSEVGISVGFVISDDCMISEAIGCYFPGRDYFHITSYGLTWGDCQLQKTIVHEYRHMQQWWQGLIQFGSDGSILNRDWLEADAYAAQYCV